MILTKYVIFNENEFQLSTRAGSINTEEIFLNDAELEAITTSVNMPDTGYEGRSFKKKVEQIDQRSPESRGDNITVAELVMSTDLQPDATETRRRHLERVKVKPTKFTTDTSTRIHHENEPSMKRELSSSDKSKWFHAMNTEVNTLQDIHC